MEADATEPQQVPNQSRLIAWAILIALIAAVNYAGRFSSSGTNTHKGADQELYSFSKFGGGTIVYAIWLGIVLVICVDRFDLLAFRRPRSWSRALGAAVAVVVAIFLWEYVVAFIPLPESPGKEQGITNVAWEPKHAAAFVANFVLFAAIAPFVEELTFRGAGQSLLRFLGRRPSIVLVGVAFGLAHGLVEALLVLVPFGMALAWLRDRTGSAVPGMFVHALFNGTALAYIVVR